MNNTNYSNRDEGNEGDDGCSNHPLDHLHPCKDVFQIRPNPSDPLDPRSKKRWAETAFLELWPPQLGQSLVDMIQKPGTSVAPRDRYNLRNRPNRNQHGPPKFPLQ